MRGAPLHFALMWGLLLLLLIALLLVLVLFTALVLWGSLHPPRHGPAYALARGLPADPGDLGLDAAQWWLDRPDGARLPVWELETDAQATPLTAVFVHGWAQSRHDMLARLDPYRQLCRRIVLYDLRGHGDAEGSASRLSHDEHLDLMDLLGRIDDRRLVLVGLSMGAVIAIHAAAEADVALRDRVAGIVAYGPYVDIHESLRGRLRVQQMPTRPISDLVMLARRVMGIRHRDLLAAARRVPCPMLIVHGREDIIAPLRHAEQITDAAADAALHVVDGAAHLDAPHIAPDEHRRIVSEFLESLQVQQRPANAVAGEDQLEARRVRSLRGQ